VCERIEYRGENLADQDVQRMNMEFMSAGRLSPASQVATPQSRPNLLPDVVVQPQRALGLLRRLDG
jgi:hypothetical protein